MRRKPGRVQADVFDGTSTATPMKRAGAALQWLPDGAKSLPQDYWDPQGYWVATNMYVQTPAYNTTLVPKGTEPRTWQDLLDPKWKGKMAWATHPTSSGAPGFVGLVLTEMGEEKGKAYLRSSPARTSSSSAARPASIVDQAIAGEYPIVLQIFNHQPLISARARRAGRLDPDEPGHGGCSRSPA